MVYTKILVPVDGSKISETAALRAVEIAKCYKSKILALHIVPTLGDMYLEEANRILDNVVNFCRKAGVDIDKRVREGKPREVIVKVADESGADLIIMGTKGKRGLGRTLTGSITEHVSKSAKCCVLIVRST